MPRLTLSREKLRANFENLEDMFSGEDVSWGIVSKLFCGDMGFISEVLDLGIDEVHDARILNLRSIKQERPQIRTVYIKPPAHSAIPDVVAWADVSFNTELSTLAELNTEALKQDKIHGVVIMVEMGDLREGVLPESLLDFYRIALTFDRLEVRGIGTNLNCLSGVMPSQEVLTELVGLKDMLEERTGTEIQLVTAGTTVTLPMMLDGDLPYGINHFRVGEVLYFGKNLVEDETFEGWHDDVLELHADVIEVREKTMNPTGPLGTNPFGKTLEIEDSDRVAHRAIVDIGYLDVNPDFLIPDADVDIIDASSDMLVLDIGANRNDIAVGDTLTFRLKYMGALHLMSSDYIEKVVASMGAELAAAS